MNKPVSNNESRGRIIIGVAMENHVLTCHWLFYGTEAEHYYYFFMYSMVQ
jgi:hypothetical protein